MDGIRPTKVPGEILRTFKAYPTRFRILPVKVQAYILPAGGHHNFAGRTFQNCARTSSNFGEKCQKVLDSPDINYILERISTVQFYTNPSILSFSARLDGSVFISAQLINREHYADRSPEVPFLVSLLAAPCHIKGSLGLTMALQTCLFYIYWP